MARPKPSSPSPRVYAAFTVALAMGLAIFLIWWATSERRARRDADEAAVAAAQPPPPSKEALIEAALPRGGSLTGSTGDPSFAVDRLTGATLVRVNRSTDELEPWLAESWIASDDHLIYTVKLRPGLTSVDGRALTASDAASSLGEIHVMGKPIAVRALDPLTLELRFASPFAPGLRVLDRYPIPGFGPFMEATASAQSTSAGKPRAFKRNVNYWRKAANGSSLPYLDEIVLAIARPKSGPPDGGEDFDEEPIRAEDFEAAKKLEVSGKARLFELGPGLDADALWFAPGAEIAGASRRSAGGAKADPPSSAGETDRPWLTSETLRLAISAAVDRRAYCKQVFYGACDPMPGPVSPANAAWFNPDVPLGQANPQLARAMLAELGLRDRNGDGLLDDATRRPLRFTLLIRRDVSASARAATFLAATLKEIGVQMDVTPLDAKTFASRRQRGDYDAMYDRIEFNDTDPAMNLEFWLSSGAAHVWNPSGRRVADWERQIDELMLKNTATFNRIERLQAFVDAQKIYLQHMPAIFFGAPHIRIATSMRTLNATPSPLRPHVLWNSESLAALK